jgi:hypothetical protein
VFFGEVTNAVIEWPRMFGLTLPAAGHVDPEDEAVAWTRVFRVVDGQDDTSDSVLTNGGEGFRDQGRDINLRVPFLQSGHRLYKHPVLPEIRY